LCLSVFLFRLLLRAAPLLLFLVFSRIMRDAMRGWYVPPGPGGAGSPGGSGDGGRSGAPGGEASPRAGRDPYSVLGCSRSSSDEEIKKRYRELAARYHPDKFIGQKLDDEFVALASRRFQQIQEAYGRIRAERGL